VLLVHAHGDENGYRDYQDRAMATSLSFEGQMGGPRRCNDSALTLGVTLRSTLQLLDLVKLSVEVG
jgi:hypothetical protein